MQRYNIALLPTDPAVQEVISELSKKNFGAIHDDYILGPQALAHITICHFRCEDQKDAVRAFKRVPTKTVIKLKLQGFQIRPGTQINPGKYIAEFSAELSDGLRAYREACVSHLSKQGIIVLATEDAYSPHMTLARLSKAPSSAPEIEIPFSGAIAFRPALGCGTESGVFLKEIVT